MINFGIVFLTSLLIFRNVDRDEYGLYVLILSLFAIIELFMGGYNQAILRFLKDTISLEDKKQIILYTVYYKYFILLLFFIFILIINHFELVSLFINDYEKVAGIIDKYLLIGCFSTVLSILTGVSFSILTAMYHYKITNNSMILKNISYLLIVFYLIFVTQEYIVYLYVNMLLNFVLLICISILLSKKYPEYSLVRLIQNKLQLSIYKKYLLSYATPLTTISLLTYVKNHLPILILGKEFELSDVAVFAIIKKFFKTIHTLAGSFFQPLISKFVDMKNNNVTHYKVVMNKLFYMSYLFRIGIYLVLLVVGPFFFYIYKLEYSEFHNLIYAVLGFEFVMAGVMTVYGTVLNINKTTKYILYISIYRFLFEILLIYFILFEYGILGAALILMLSRMVEVLSAYYFVKRENILKFDIISILLFIPIAFYFSIQGLM